MGPSLVSFHIPMDPIRFAQAAGAAIVAPARQARGGVAACVQAAARRLRLVGAILSPVAVLLLAPGVPSTSAVELRGQDVELLGRIHGTRPPDGYFEIRRSDPGAYEFGRGWKNRTGLGIEIGSGDPSSDTDVARTNRTGFEAAAVTGLGRREAPVEGTFTFPVVLGLFADSSSTAPYSAEEIQREYFTGPNSRYRTISEYYDEVSRGRVDLRGETFAWKRSDLERETVTGTSSGLGRDAKVGEYIVDLIEQLDASGVDWSRFDNDGPDGVPDSGDDDGFVDVLAVIHPTEGAECGKPGSSTKIWSHRWQLRAALDDPDAGPYETSTPSAAGGNIKIDDYVIVPTLECDWEDEDENDLNQIGVLAHELGHGFGLPDLYGTGSRFVGGAGNWGLMGTGSWGCNASPSLQRADRPCHPGAWTKYVMGWVEADTIPAGADLRSLTLEPVQAGGRIVRVETNDGSGEYFLLEHRDRQGFDDDLMEEGLLVWHVDPSQVDVQWGANRVNADTDHPGVWLRQADGLNELMAVGGGRGDPGDPFPGLERKREFHAGTVPSSFTHDGASSGLTITDIRKGFSSIGFDLSNRYHTVTLRTEGDDGSAGFSVDGAQSPSSPHSFLSAPFEHHVIQADPGRTISDGIRVGFRGWEDGSCRTRDFEPGRADSSLVATYGDREIHFAVEMTSPSDTVTPGRLEFQPEPCENAWVPEGTTFRIEAVARPGFEFIEWSGAFAGRSNPFMIDAVEPLEAGARFDVTYSVASNPTRVDLVAAVEQQVVLQAVNGNDPVTWSVAEGSLPQGLELRDEGTIIGAPLEDGTFPVGLEAEDAIGLRASLELELTVDRPPVGTGTLTSPFLMGSEKPTTLQEDYMDWIGNRNGAYDVGDFRAFLRRHPDAPETVPAAARRDPVIVPAVRLRPPDEGGATPEGEEGASSGAGSSGGGGAP